MKGGALKEFASPIRFGMATILGGGTQILSWIHIEDLCRIYLKAIQENMHGPYNAVAPKPVNNKELVLELAKRRRGRTFLPVHVPEFALKLALGEMSIEVLKSTTVSSRKIQATGFQFLFPSVKSAIEDLIK
jgi:NAD dependent epimerase/dehydratase family enzyme